MEWYSQLKRPSGKGVADCISGVAPEVWEVGVHASLSAEPIHMFAQILSGTQMKYRSLWRQGAALRLEELM